MIIPIRCYTCGKPIAQVWEEYVKRVEQGEDRKKVLDSLGLERYCCRCIFFKSCGPWQRTVSKFKKF